MRLFSTIAQDTSQLIAQLPLLGEKENLGSIVKDKYADLIGVSRNPLEDISILETVDFVMKGGKVVKEP